MKIEDFKNETDLEPVLVHTKTGKGKNARRVTVAAVVTDNNLYIAKAQCSKDDQFRKTVGVSKALGRLTGLIKNHEDGHKLFDMLHRYEHTVDVVEYPRDYDRKEVLQVIDKIK